MEFRLADPELKPLEEEDVTELLNQPVYLRVAMINSRDGTPLVHPIWYYYENEKFFAVSSKDGTKIRSLKNSDDRNHAPFHRNLEGLMISMALRHLI